MEIYPQSYPFMCTNIPQVTLEVEDAQWISGATAVSPVTLHNFDPRFLGMKAIQQGTVLCPSGSLCAAAGGPCQQQYMQLLLKPCCQGAEGPTQKQPKGGLLSSGHKTDSFSMDP